MKRRLRIAVSVFFALVAVSFAVLWVRSYWRQDSAHFLFQSRVFEAWSATGEIHWGVGYQVSVHGMDLEVHSKPISPNRETFSVLGFGMILTHHGYMYSVPHWFLVLVSTGIATISWWKWRPASRYSLRTLLIVTTLVAVVLGLAVWASR